MDQVTTSPTKFYQTRKFWLRVLTLQMMLVVIMFSFVIYRPGLDFEHTVKGISYALGSPILLFGGIQMLTMVPMLIFHTIQTLLLFFTFSRPSPKLIYPIALFTLTNIGLFATLMLFASGN